jgi:hypothetical protein
MLEANTVTGVTLVSVDVLDSEQTLQSVRVGLETAIGHGLVVLNGDGKPVINDSVLGKSIEIDPSNIIPTRQENQHPIGSALATFFSEIPGISYETIMSVHEQGVGFGVIAHTLWLTSELDGDAQIFRALLEAKQTGDFSRFILEDGTTPENWGQLKKAILAKDKKHGLGIVISESNTPGQGNGNNESNSNNGTGNGNGGGTGKGNGNGNGKGGGNGNGNGNGKDKK